MKLKIEPGFAAFVIALSLLAGKTAQVYLLAAALHELAHLLVLLAAGKRAVAMALRFAEAQIITPPLSDREELICAAAGPAANLLCFSLLHHRAPGFAVCSLLLAGYNLLPVLPLDGGRILLVLLARCTGTDTAQKTCTRISTGFGVLMLFAALFFMLFRDAGCFPLLAAGALVLRLRRMRRQEEKQVAFPGHCG